MSMSKRLTDERLAEIRDHARHPGYPHCECVAPLLSHIDAQQAEIDRLRELASELAVALLTHRGCSMFVFHDLQRQGDEALLAHARSAGVLQ